MTTGTLPEADGCVRAEERLDDLQRNGCRIIQRPDLFCFGMDAVLLSAFARVKQGDRVLDLCSGNGVVPILMDARLPERLREGRSVRFTGVEINPVCVDMARRSARMNGQEERIHFLEGDIRQIGRNRQIGRKEAKGLKRPEEVCAPSSYDSVTVNPPYMTGGGGLTGNNTGRMIARHEMLCTIDDVAAAAAYALKQEGHLFLVHRPHRLGDIFRALKEHGLAVKRLRMVHPFADQEANMVLIDAAKGGRMYVHVEAPLIVFERPGVYTEEVSGIYS